MTPGRVSESRRGLVWQTGWWHGRSLWGAGCSLPRRRRSCELRAPRPAPTGPTPSSLEPLARHDLQPRPLSWPLRPSSAPAARTHPPRAASEILSPGDPAHTRLTPGPGPGLTLAPHIHLRIVWGFRGSGVCPSHQSRRPGGQRRWQSHLWSPRYSGQGQALREDLRKHPESLFPGCGQAPSCSTGLRPASG